MFCWSVFIQGHWVVKTFIWERLLFLGLAFMLVNPSHLEIAGVLINQHLANAGAVITLVLIFLWQKNRKAKAGLQSA
jgi:uncharacterized membrane protein